jgi:SAM-dependent methyltransferase
MGSSPSILDAVVIPFVQGPKILDVGCGFGRWGALITSNYWETCSGGPTGRPEITGCDGYLPNVNLAKRSGFYTQVNHFIFPPLSFPDNSYDTVLLLDVIEHLKNENGVMLIDEAKRITSHRVILSTPNWYAIRSAHATMTGWNDLEAHLSYWTRDHLRRRGFRLYGAGWRAGGRYWRGILKRINLLTLYDAAIRPSLVSMSRYFPLFAENVVGVWDKK